MLTLVPCRRFGGVPKWLKGPDSKSGRPALPVQEFESLHLRHVGASFVSLAPTYFISQSALTPLLLLSKSNPLRWASIWVWVQTRKLRHLYCLDEPPQSKLCIACSGFLFFAQNISLPPPYPAGFSRKKSGDFSPAFVIAPTAYMTRCRPLPSPQRAAPRSPAPAG